MPDSMMNHHNAIAVIPARSGSKGLPNKNVLPICGRPMLSYSAEAALESGCFDHVVLSTDSESYGKIGEDLGCEVLYRSEDLASDSATTYDVIAHVLASFDSMPGDICLLQPTSPLRDAFYVKSAMDDFAACRDDYDFLVSVTEASHPKFLIGDIGASGDLSYLDMQLRNYHRQSHLEYYPNGAIFIGKAQSYLSRGDFFGSKSKAFVMPKWASVDVDDEFDYIVASLLMERRVCK